MHGERGGGDVFLPVPTLYGSYIEQMIIRGEEKNTDQH